MVAVEPPLLPTPAEQFGALFDEVQMRGLFADSKAFADAVPRADPPEIVGAYAAAAPLDDEALTRFVTTWFVLPGDDPPAPTEPPPGLPLREHIRALWPLLTRAPVRAEGSALALDHRFVVPGGRFRELYYWDSYFTLLGLMRDGEVALAQDMVANFTDLIERLGHIPNGTRTYYCGRSQPPVYALMIDLVPAADRATETQRLAALVREHAFWMRGASTLNRAGENERVVRFADGALLNRYWDARAVPREESWREDVLTARASGRPAPEVYRDLRAGAESGWDFSSRWLGDGRTLATIRTTRLVPVDLNALLYMIETIAAAHARRLGDDATARRFGDLAESRRIALDRLWGERDGRYGDFDLDTGRLRPHISAATLFPLFAGMTTQAQADAVATLVEAQLLAPGGLRTTPVATGQQWDAPNGWAPLQWIAIEGLKRYGHHTLAARIAAAWLGTVRGHYQQTGQLLEKYDVETGRAGGGGEYAVQAGFGWTNGVTAALLDQGFS